MENKERKAKRVLIVSYHLYPDSAVGAKRMSELAITLQNMGFDVTAIGAKLGKKIIVDKALENKIKPVKIVKIADPKKLSNILWYNIKKLRKDRQVPSINCGNKAEQPSMKDGYSGIRHNMRSLSAILDGKLYWCLRVMMRISYFRLSRRFDLVISSGPPMVAHVASMVGCWIHSAKWIIDLRDPWMGVDKLDPKVWNRQRILIENYFEKKCFSRCDQVICVSPGIKRLIEKRYPSIDRKSTVILNGFDGDLTHNARPISGRLVLLYAGALYFNRNPFPLLQAFAKLAKSPNVDRDKLSFVLVGECAAWKGLSVVGWINENNMGDCVSIRPRVDSEEIRKVMKNVNILVNFAQGQPLQIPAKTYDYFASGKESLVITEKEGDTAMVIEQSGAGRIAKPDDINEIYTALNELYNEYVVNEKVYLAPKDIYQIYSRETQVNKYKEIIDQLI